MSTMKDIPRLKVHLEKGREVWRWVSGRCPFCGKVRHIHGGGSLDGDPRTLLGYRAAHCFPDSKCPGGSYFLTEEEGTYKVESLR